MPRSHLALTSLLLAAIVGIGWFLLRDPGSPAPIAPEHEPDRAAAAASVDVAEASPAAPTAPPVETERSLAEASAPVAAPAADVEAKPTRRLHGTIVVTDADGREHADCDGEIELEVHVPLDEESSLVDSHRTAVTGGVWQADVPANAVQLQVDELMLDGNAALCFDEVALTADDRPIALRARWRQAMRLRVLGEDTGADLVGITVVAMDHWPYDSHAHPGDRAATPLLRGGRSPLALLPRGRADQVHYCVKATGYAWRPIALSTSATGERELRLPPGGDVELTLVGEVPGDTTLRVRSFAAPPLGAPAADTVPSGMPLGEFRVRGTGPVVVDALPAGDWSLSVEKGDWLVLGQTRVTVVSGTIVPATITLRGDIRRPDSCQVRGTLTVSPRWGDSLRLELEPVDALETWANGTTWNLTDLERLAEGRYAWGQELLAGRWQVLVSGTEYRTSFEVGPGLSNLVDLVVPDPSDVRVRIVDADTGLPVPDARPSFYSLVEGWSGGWSHESMEQGDDDWWTCLAPPGRITIHVHPQGYSWSHRQYDVRPGANEFVVRIARACGVEITLTDGDVTVPWPNFVHVELEHTTSKAGAAYWSGNKTAAKEPGEHVVKIGTIEGFAPIPPRTVVIEPGKWTPVEVALQRVQ